MSCIDCNALRLEVMQRYVLYISITDREECESPSDPQEKRDLATTIGKAVRRGICHDCTARGRTT